MNGTPPVPSRSRILIDLSLDVEEVEVKQEPKRDASSDEKKEPPVIDFHRIANSEDFYCAIDHKLMKNPVFSVPCGHRFNKKAIIECFKKSQKKICPVCRTDSRELVEDRMLKQMIDNYRKEAQLSKEEESSEASSEEVDMKVSLSKEQIKAALKEIVDIHRQGSEGTTVALEMALNLQQENPEYAEHISKYINYFLQKKDNPSTHIQPGQTPYPSGVNPASTLLLGHPGARPAQFSQSIPSPQSTSQRMLQGFAPAPQRSMSSEPPQLTPQRHMPSLPPPQTPPRLPMPSTPPSQSASQPSKQSLSPPAPLQSSFFSHQTLQADVTQKQSKTSPVMTQSASIPTAKKPHAGMVFQPMMPPQSLLTALRRRDEAARQQPESLPFKPTRSQAFEEKTKDHQDPGDTKRPILKRERDEKSVESDVPKMDEMAVAEEEEQGIEPLKKKPRLHSDDKVENLFFLVKSGSQQAFKKALTPNLVESVDKEGYPLLHRVVLDKRGIVFVRILIKAGFPINMPGPQGNTALHLAAENNLARLVKELLRLKADRTIKNAQGLTPEETIHEKGTQYMKSLFEDPEEIIDNEEKEYL